MIGTLLLNVGTPDAPRTPEVRRYLAEFLADGRVLDMHPIARWLLLHGVILRTRPARSAAAYRKIWTERGSPLLFHCQDLAAGLQATLGQGYRVELAMRYGSPAAPPALARLQAAGCDRIVVLPLFPQYAAASTGAALDAVFGAVAAMPVIPSLTVVDAFHAEPAFLDAMEQLTREGLQGFEADHVLFSFHGLPEHQVRNAELPGPDGRVAGTCLAEAGCCDALGRTNRACYRAQCFATARALAARLELPEDGWSLAFQSRLGKVPWIRPYTDEVLGALPGRGVRRLAVLTPSFVTDCLETLEEIGMAGQETFRAAGGEEFRLVPCLNAHPAWVEGLAGMVRRAAGQPDRPAEARGAAGTAAR